MICIVNYNGFVDMKKILVSLLVFLLGIGCVNAQNHENRRGNNGNRPSFEQFLAEKTNFMVKEMCLNAADSTRFVALYMQLQKEKGALMHKYRNGREVFRKLHNGEELPDSLYLKIVMNDAKIQEEDARLEREYVEKFAKILTPKQLFSYMVADRKFKNSFMQRRPNARDKEKGQRE